MTSIKSLFIAAASALTGFLPLAGQETLVLKDGSRLYGHTSTEDYTNKTITFSTDSAIVVEKTANVVYSAPYLRPLRNMGKTWRDWFETHPERVVTEGGTRSAYLGDITCKTPARKDLSGEVIILEHGDSTVTFFTIGSNRITLKKNEEVDHIEYAPRDILSLVGTVEEVTTQSGFPMQGQLVADHSSHLVLLTDDGVRNIIPYSKIKSRRTLPFNTNLHVAKQVKFLTCLNVRDSNQPVCGIIVERNYRTADNPQAYYELCDSTGRRSMKVYFKDVLSTSLAANNAYLKDNKDVVIGNDDDILVNRVPAGKATCIETNEGKEIADTAGIVKVKYSDLKGGMLCIHYKDLPLNSMFTFTEMEECKPAETADKDKGKDKGKENREAQPRALYKASYRDIYDNSFMPVGSSVSPAGNVSVQYGPVTPGKAYLLIRRSDKATYLIKIEP